MPGALAHIRQVHGVDPVRHLARTPQVLPLTPAVALPCFSCPVSSSAPITSPRRRPDCRAASSRPATANRRTTPIAANVSQHGPVQQPLRPARRPVARLLGDHPAVAFRQPADQCTDVLSRLQPRLRPGKARPPAGPAAPPVSAPATRSLSWQQQPPSILLLSRTHDRQAAAPRPTTASHPRRRSNPQWLLPYYARGYAQVCITFHVQSARLRRSNNCCATFSCRRIEPDRRFCARLPPRPSPGCRAQISEVGPS